MMMVKKWIKFYGWFNFFSSSICLEGNFKHFDIFVSWNFFFSKEKHVRKSLSITIPVGQIEMS